MMLSAPPRAKVQFHACKLSPGLSLSVPCVCSPSLCLILGVMGSMLLKDPHHHKLDKKLQFTSGETSPRVLTGQARIQTHTTFQIMFCDNVLGESCFDMRNRVTYQ